MPWREGRSKQQVLKADDAGKPHRSKSTFLAVSSDEVDPAVGVHSEESMVLGSVIAIRLAMAKHSPANGAMPTRLARYDSRVVVTASEGKNSSL